jgi:hydrogenase nickel incorporation protein HypA/HybF
VHELSIAANLIALAVDAIRADPGTAAAPSLRVEEVTLRLGRLAGVEADSLLFCYDIAARDTPLAGSRLVIEDVPVAVFCPACQAVLELPTIQSFFCPRCGQPTADIRRGRELELATIRLTDTPPGPDGSERPE